LSQVSVLDLTAARAGPTCVRQLADLGARVFQVSRPGGGALEQFVSSDRENLHRNKRSVAIDLQSDQGRDVLYRLVRQVDVVVENFRPDVKYRLKVDYETLSTMNPRLIYGSISGFGQDGPYGPRGGVDQIAQGLGGLMSVTGPPGSGPWRVGIPITDLCAGIFLAQGILAALIVRERTGRGQWVKTSLLESMIAMLDFQATRWLIDGEVPGQAGNDHPTAFPMGVFPTADEPINLAAFGQEMWINFLKTIGAEEVVDDPRFAPRERNKHREELRAICEERLRERTATEWIESLNAAGIPCGPILDIGQVFADPQVQHLGMVRQVEHPTHGRLNIVRSPIDLSETPPTVRTAAPLPGADTAAVLEEFGFTQNEIQLLLAAGVVDQRKG
jgi:crotonobetainyl-CoA:carnitine CoA-transferase CaiB-like acyl-CoA transferase